MRIFNDLLFHHGFVTNEELARQLAPGHPFEKAQPSPPTGASHPHLHPREQVRARQARLVRSVTALSPFR